MKYLSIIVLTSLFASSTHSFATEADGACLNCSEAGGGTAAKLNTAVDAIAKAIKPQDAHWIDANFFVDTKPVGKELDVVFKNPSDLNLSQSQMTKVWGVYSDFLNQKNLTDALKVVNGQGKNLQHEEKLLLLSMVGSRLSSGYSSTGKENKDINSVYMNAVKAGSEGGVCGDIHKLLGEVAKNLGFEAVGRHTGQWQQNLDKDNAGGHAILHFRDPKTGEYYVQNYSQVYNTRQKTLQSAVDVSTKVLGVLHGQTYVESRPGKLHEYVPATAQWVENQIKGVAGFKPDASVATVKIGEHEKTLALQMGTENIKGFMLSSRVNTDEGTYQLDAAGLATRGEYKKEFKDRMIDEVKVTSEAYGGALRLSAPGFDAWSDTYKQGERNTFFFGGNIKGTARVNDTTGKIEINSVNLDFKPKGGDQTKTTTAGTRTEVKAGVEHEWKDLNLKASADRTWGFIPVEIEQKHRPKMQTTYDRVGIVYDTSKPDKKEAYLVVGADVYFLEGVNVNSAVAVKNSIKAVLPTEKLGTFTIAADLGKIVSNKSKDPFYDTVPTTSVGIDWNKQLNKMLDVGFNVSYTKGTQIQPFGVIGPVTPVMGGPEKKVQGMVYLHGKF
ncbi:hypothetical protein [Bdellovibrio sp. NC01]|uniref:hypothetical protein n=1 Tax=Bdellovibrio sp. NC01 TaxID=2220073 RepID=UPI00115A78B9|nr:hypothetical protein [Bdellovibrio sp. NC01]QDK38203.1 hypothetical protein DOE51_11715 [Bdellovibrio sp. NC01]